MKIDSVRRVAVAVMLSGSMLGTLAHSQGAYPDRPVKIVVPWAAGGFTDRLARMVGQHISQSIGQPVIVDNRPGAGGAIGSEYAASAAPDGYSLLLNTTDGTVRMMQDHRVDPVNSFAQVSVLAAQPIFLSVGPKLQVKSLQDFIAAAKAQPGNIAYASPGEGSAINIAMESFSKSAGIKLNHIPYKGTGPALTDVMAGQVECILLSIQGASGNFASGRLVPLAVTAPKRMDQLPAVPTFAESGMPSFTFGLTYILAAPKGTPAAIVERLSAAARAAMAAPDIRKQLSEGGTTPIGSNQADALAYMKAEVARWAPVIK